MFKQVLSYLLMAGLVTLFYACDKDDPVPQQQDNLPRYLLKTITWDNGVTATSSYNTDSTLLEIEYAFRGAGGKAVFGWTGKTLAETYDDRSMYKNVFDYDTEGKVTRIRNIARIGSSPTGYMLEFHYNAAKKVDSMKRISSDEAGIHLLSASGYHYDNAGDIEKIVTKMDNSVITHTVDSWSPVLSFNPCHYIETSLSENYMIYNYAVMQQLQKLNKLPAKVTRGVQTGTNPSYIDKIEEQVYTISNYRIDKVVSTITYPGYPASNATIGSVYSYY